MHAGWCEKSVERKEKALRDAAHNIRRNAINRMVTPDASAGPQKKKIKGPFIVDCNSEIRVIEEEKKPSRARDQETKRLEVEERRIAFDERCLQLESRAQESQSEGRRAEFEWKKFLIRFYALS